VKLVVKRLTLILVIVVLIGSAFGGSVASGVTHIPHENPATARTDFNLAVCVLHYAEIFDLVADRQYPTALTLLEELNLDFVHLPEELIFIMNTYSALSTELTNTLDELHNTLDRCEWLLSQNKPDEALVELDGARRLITEATALIHDIDRATQELFQTLAAFALPQDAEALNVAKARLESALERLAELEAWYRDYVQTLEAEATGEQTLLVTELTLAISPTQVWVGDQITLSGLLRSTEGPLGGRQVSIFLEGDLFCSATTLGDGTYETSLALPYRYMPLMIVQASYLPAGDDKKTFTAASSEIREISVLFNVTNIKMAIPDEAYPGWTTRISGQLSSQGATGGRNVDVLVDGEVLFSASTGSSGFFQHDVTLDGDAPLGERMLRAIVGPDNESRSAGTSADGILSVMKVTPELEVEVPRFVILPQGIEWTGQVWPPLRTQTWVDIRGSVTSTLPLEGAALTVGMAQASAAGTVDAGDFESRVALPYSFGTVGSEHMEVKVVPSEPWYHPAAQTVQTFVINLFYLAIAVAGLVLAVLIVPARILGMARRRKGVSTPAEKSAMGRALGKAWLPEMKPAAGDYRSMILQAYYMVAAAVQRVASVFLEPHMTLREFFSKVASPKSRFGQLFHKLTGLAEEALYSSHVLGSAQASLAQDLRLQLRRTWLMLHRGPHTEKSAAPEEKYDTP